MRPWSWVFDIRSLRAVIGNTISMGLKIAYLIDRILQDDIKNTKLVVLLVRFDLNSQCPDISEPWSGRALLKI